MNALGAVMTRMAWETSPPALFPLPPVIRFVPERERCTCGGRLFVQKTRRKTVLCLTGPFIAHETILACRNCSRIFTSEALERLVSSRCSVAWDVLVFVGRALFQRYRSAREIRDELLTRNVSLSLSEIDCLGRKFIAFLAAGHQRARPRVRRAMEFNGGYILHLDAAHDGDAPALMTGMDGLSKIVLANVKLPGENADRIVPFLQKLKADYGKPTALVHDMGTGILRAVSLVFPDIPDFICHFHFLRDIGKDFLEPAYKIIRQRLRYHATASRLNDLVREARARLIEQDSTPQILADSIKDATLPQERRLMPVASAYSLALWCLQGKRAGNGYGFPFDRPLLEFVERLLALNRIMPDLLDKLPKGSQSENRFMHRLAREARCLGRDVHLLGRALTELRWRCGIFDRLRQAMHIAPTDGGKGLNDEGDAQALLSIRQGVNQFRRELDDNAELANDSLCQKMAKQIDKYEDKLFVDPIKVTTPNGEILIYPNRTNNILEQFFRKMRRGHRRKTGNDSMRMTLKAMLADTPLVKNLDNPKYMEMLLDGKEKLEELFAELAPVLLKDIPSQVDEERILPGFHRLMKTDSLPSLVLQAIGKLADSTKSN